MSQSVRAVSSATAEHSTDSPSTGARRFSVSFVRQPPGSASVQSLRASMKTTPFQLSTASQRTVVDRGSVRANGDNMQLGRIGQCNASATHSSASHATFVNSRSTLGFNNQSASVALHVASLQRSAATSFATYSHSYDSSQTPTAQMTVGITSASPQFKSRGSNLSPEIADLGIGIAAEPRESYGWTKVSTTTGEHVTLFDEVSCLNDLASRRV